jgi:predicted  nucleic acid-binding Zn-ribbon protein
MQATKRQQNKCNSCGYTWYPRGKNISLKCPSCGGSEISIVASRIGGVGVVLLIVIGLIIFGVGKKNTSTEPEIASASAGTPMVVEQKDIVQTNSEPSVANGDLETGVAIASNEKIVTARNQINTSNNLEAHTNTSIGVKSNSEPEVNEISVQTPSQICRSESNYFSRNNCIWRECAKPEFASLQECADKKPRDHTEVEGH